MMKLIESDYTQKAFESVGFKLTDSQKATLIWNKPNITRLEKLSKLRKLKDETEDVALKVQIIERLVYEEKSLALFWDSSTKGTLYVVVSDRPCGYFEKCRTALNYAERIARAENEKVDIEKHSVVRGDIIPMVKSGARSNPEFFGKLQDEWVKYDGWPIARMTLNESGEIVGLWSNEQRREYDRVVDGYYEKRFENQFIPFPCIPEVGTLIKLTTTGEYGVVATTAGEWRSFLGRVQDGLPVDYSDASIKVYFLTEQGRWSHRHCSPIYLEVELPDTNANDEKQAAYFRAVDALSDYLVGNKDSVDEASVIETAKEYAEVCEREKAIREPKSIDEVFE